MTREETLDAAKKAVMVDRNKDYGDPENNFDEIAHLWNTYADGKNPLRAYDVAVMMILVKIARLKTSPNKSDHWIDIAGYSACGAEASHAE